MVVNIKKHKEWKNMKNIIKEKIFDIVTELNADDCKFSTVWKGYEVYIPVYLKPVCIGLPYVILVKGNNVRLSTDKEAMEFLDYEANMA